MLGESLASSIRSVSVAELRANNLENQAWVGIRGKVYDLTKFLDRYVLLPSIEKSSLLVGREKKGKRIGDLSGDGDFTS